MATQQKQPYDFAGQMWLLRPRMTSATRRYNTSLKGFAPAAKSIILSFLGRNIAKTVATNKLRREGFGTSYLVRMV